jgi:hypothetical protein
MPEAALDVWSAVGAKRRGIDGAEHSAILPYVMAGRTTGTCPAVPALAAVCHARVLLAISRRICLTYEAAIRTGSPHTSAAIRATQTATAHTTA